MHKVFYCDVCNTLVPFYTLGKFVRFFLLRKRPLKWLNLFTSQVLLKFQNKFLREDEILHYLKDFTKNEIEEMGALFFEKKLQQNLIPQTLKLLKEYKKNGYILVLVSAGLYEYLHFFTQTDIIEIDAVLASQLDYQEGKSKGSINTSHYIYGEQKITAIKNFENELNNQLKNTRQIQMVHGSHASHHKQDEKTFNSLRSNENKIEEVHSTHSSNESQFARAAISDHISDIPLLEYVDKAYIINPNNSEFLSYSQKKKWVQI